MTADKPSITALAILRSLVLQAQDPQRRLLLPVAWNEPHERLLTAVDPKGRKWIQNARSSGFRGRLYFLEELLLPGVQTHYILRKRFIEDLARHCIEKRKFTQVVNIAAGFDSLCYRLHGEFPSVKFFEIDHPATQAAKRTGLDSLGFASSLTLLTADLRRAAPADVLEAEPAYDHGARTLFIAEGLLMYLDAKVIKSIFEGIRQRSGSGSCIVFSFIEHLGGKGGGTPLLRWWLSRRGEPFTWAIGRDPLEAFLRGLHLDLEDVVDAGALSQRYLVPDGLAKTYGAFGELLAVAARRDPSVGL